MNIAQRPVELLDEPVVDLHHVRGALRLLPVTSAVAAVAKMHAELHIARNALAVHGEALDDARLDIGKTRMAHALPLSHLGRNVPLDGKVLVRNRFTDLHNLPEKLGAVDRLDERVVFVDDVRVQECRGSRQRNLEAQVLRNHAPVAQGAKHLVGGDRGFGIAEPADAELLRPHARLEAQARRRRRAAHDDLRALPGARAFGGMGDAAPRSDLLRVVFERGIVFEHEAQA